MDCMPESSREQVTLPLVLRGTRESKEKVGLPPDLGVAARLLILLLAPLYQGECLEIEDTR